MHAKYLIKHDKKFFFQMHYGHGCYGKQSQFEFALTVVEPKEFVGIIAKEIIGIDILQTCSVSGEASRRSTEKKEVGQIPPTMILCVRGENVYTLFFVQTF